MSRIGRLPIDIPSGVNVTIDGSAVTVKGPKGELALTVASPIEVKLDGSQLLVSRPDDERVSRSLHGLTRTLIANQIIGRQLWRPMTPADSDGVGSTPITLQILIREAHRG